MGLLKFDQYTFDPHRLELCIDGVVVMLRPKTAELLQALIVERERVLSKRELIQRIWHTEHVTDQSVFQAMSELRAQLAPLKAIRTFPNRGYQWVVPVVAVGQSSNAFLSRRPFVDRLRRPFVEQHFLKKWLVLPLLSALALLSSIELSETTSNELLFTHSKPDSQPQHLVASKPVQTKTRLPAIAAFSNGAASLQAGDTQRAIELLQFSVTERPGFVEARLLLAEAHLLHGNVLSAREQANSMMKSLVPQSNAYSIVASMDLISRADEQLGQMNSALSWASRAANQANSNGFECTAAELHDRVRALVQESHLPPTKLKASPVLASGFADELMQIALSREQRSQRPTEVLGSARRSEEAALPNNDPVSSGINDTKSAIERPAHCASLRGGSTGLSPILFVEPHSSNRLLSLYSHRADRRKLLI